MTVTNGSGMTVTSDSAVTTQTNTIQFAYDDSTIPVDGTIKYYHNGSHIYTSSNSFDFDAYPQFMGYTEPGISATSWNSPATGSYQWTCNSDNWQTTQNVKLVLFDGTTSAWTSTLPRVNLNSAEGIAITENGSVVYSDSSFTMSEGDTLTFGSATIAPPSGDSVLLPPPVAWI